MIADINEDALGDLLELCHNGGQRGQSSEYSWADGRGV
jgi:hypothetical protein